MELKFNLATELAVKATIAFITCASIAYVATPAQNWFGVAASVIIGVVGVIIGTYKTPPICAIKTN
jgi:hypothetical protein